MVMMKQYPFKRPVFLLMDLELVLKVMKNYVKPISRSAGSDNIFNATCSNGFKVYRNCIYSSGLTKLTIKILMLLIELKRTSYFINEAYGYITGKYPNF